MPVQAAAAHSLVALLRSRIQRQGGVVFERGIEMKLFIYTTEAKLTRDSLRQIRKAGYLTIQMSSVSLPDVKILDLECAPIKIDAVTRAAFRTIQDYGLKGTWSNVRSMFGAYVAEEMMK